MPFALPRKWRLDRKLTLAAAAAAAGVAGKNPARAWQRWETGALEPPLRVVSAIDRASSGAVTIESWRQARLNFLNAPNTADADNNPSRAAGSSGCPSTETELSLEPSAAADQAAPVRGGVESSSSSDPQLAPNGADPVS